MRRKENEWWKLEKEKENRLKERGQKITKTNQMERHEHEEKETGEREERKEGGKDERMK